MYVKIFADILQSSIWAEDSDTCKVWITMLALSNQDGLVRSTVPGISHMARVSAKKTEAALLVFQRPDENSRTPDNDGRRIERVDGGYLILNYCKYRELRDDDARREVDRERQRRHRMSRSVTPRHGPSRSVAPGNDESQSVTPCYAPSRQAEAEAEAVNTPTPLSGHATDTSVEPPVEMPPPETTPEPVREPVSAETVKLAETVMRTMVPAGNLAELVAHHGNARVKTALLLTERQGKRSLAYCAAILRRWVVEGMPEDAVGGGGPAGGNGNGNGSGQDSGGVESWPIRR